MKQSRLFFLPLLLVLFAIACTDKSLDIEVEQDACKRFKIKSPGYQLLEDPCNDSLRIRARVEFSFNNSSECLNAVNNKPVFYKSNNVEINAASFFSRIERNNLTIDDKRVDYIFEASFNDVAAARELNHLILDFNTENELGVESNTLQIRINTSCSVVESSSYKVNSNEVGIPRNQSAFTIRLWDNAAEDGDIVSVYLNGRWIIENHSLLKAGTDFTFSTALLNPGANDLAVFALNEGSSGPNTVSIAVNGEEIKNFRPGLLTGEAVRINF
ncbi:MAG: hypothetical protein ACJASF_002172 [Vicingaceae bacterium]|jgi:hypothetical protein